MTGMLLFTISSLDNEVEAITDELLR